MSKKTEPRTLAEQLSQMSKGGAAFGGCTTVAGEDGDTAESIAQTLLKKGTKKDKVTRSGRKCLKVNTKDNIYDVTIPLQSGTSIPEKVFGVGGQGGAFLADVNITNPETCAEIYAHWKAMNYIKDEITPEELYERAERIAKKKEEIRLKKAKPEKKTLVQKVKEFFAKPEAKQKSRDEREEELAEAKWKIWKEKVRKYRNEAKKISSQNLIEMIEQEFGADFPQGKCVVKLYYTNPQTKHLPIRERKILARKHPQMAYPLVSGKVATDENNGNGMHFAVYPVIDDLMPDETITRLGYKRRIDVGIQTLNILQTGLHSLGMVHRDIKPPNLLIKEDGTVIVIDFGLMQDEKYDKETLQTAANGSFFGTIGFGAPEQVPGSHTERAKVTWRADQYAVGAVVYYNLVGLPPNPLADAGPAGLSNLKLDHYKALMPSESKKLNSLVSNFARQTGIKAKKAKKIPMYINLVLAKMMQQNPADRYDTIDNCMKDLNSIQKGEAPQIILRELKKKGIQARDYAENKFTHYVHFYEPGVYAESDIEAQEREEKAAKRQQIARSWTNLQEAKKQLGFVRRNAKALTALGTGALAAVSGYVALNHPELITAAWDALGLPYLK